MAQSPALLSGTPTPVRRRRVLYLPGYDPIPPRRYRELYRREGIAQADISGYALTTAMRSDDTGFGWAVQGRFGDRVTEAEIEVLVWSDVVAASMGASIPATYAQMLRTVWAYVASGALWRLMRLRRGPVLAALYPVAMLSGQALIALAAAAVLVWALAHHVLAGVRHLLSDINIGSALHSGRRSAWAVNLAAVAVALLSLAVLP